MDESDARKAQGFFSDPIPHLGGTDTGMGDNSSGRALHQNLEPLLLSLFANLGDFRLEVRGVAIARAAERIHDSQDWHLRLADELRNRGMLGPALWSALLAARPGRASEITACQWTESNLKRERSRGGFGSDADGRPRGQPPALRDQRSTMKLDPVGDSGSGASPTGGSLCLVQVECPRSGNHGWLYVPIFIRADTLAIHIARQLGMDTVVTVNSVSLNVQYSLSTPTGEPFTQSLAEVGERVHLHLLWEVLSSLPTMGWTPSSC